MRGSSSAGVTGKGKLDLRTKGLTPKPSSPDQLVCTEHLVLYPSHSRQAAIGVTLLMLNLIYPCLRPFVDYERCEQRS